MFGGWSLSIHGETFTWGDASEDGPYHYDNYYDGNGHTVTALGLIGSPDLASVDGSDVTGTVAGFLQYGGYGERTQTSTNNNLNVTYNGRNYTSVTSTYSFYVDLWSGWLSSSCSAVYTGSGGTFYEYEDTEGNGYISGSENGVVIFRNWYVNTQETSSYDLTLPNGHHYNTLTTYTSYGSSGYGEVYASTVQVYTNPELPYDPWFYVNNDSFGSLVGYESGFYLNGTWYVDGDASSSINLTLPNGHGYTTCTVTTTYSLDESGQPVATTSNPVYSNSNGSFTVDVSTGVISGSESGVRDSTGNWYVDGNDSTSVNLTLWPGHVYTTHTIHTIYVPDGNGGALAFPTESYSNGNGESFTIDPVTGQLQGSEGGYKVGGTWYVNNVSTGNTSLTLPNGHVYTSWSADTVYVIDTIDVMQVTTTTYTSSSGASFTVNPADGSLSGSEGGVLASDGTWYVNSNDTFSVNLTLPNGHVYTSEHYDVSYSLNGYGGIDSHVNQSYSNSSGDTFYVYHNDDSAYYSVNGSENGYVNGSSWYLNGSYTWSTSFTLPNGHVYTSITNYTTYYLDEYYNLASYSYQQYSGNGYSFTLVPNAANGAYFYGSDSGYTDGSSWYVDGPLPVSTPSSGVPSLSLFGATYTFKPSDSSRFTYYNADGSSASNGYTDAYASSDGGSVQIYYYWTPQTEISNYVDGWDPYAGSFTAYYQGDITNLVFDNYRSGPALGPDQLWVNGTLYHWQEGWIDADGNIIDNYNDDLSLSFTGSVRSFNSGTTTAAITLNGSSIGTYAHDGTFNVGSNILEVGTPNRTEPLFTGTTIWVDGTPYNFTYGFEDTAGYRADVYSNSDGTLNLFGTTAHPTTATVRLYTNGLASNGTATFGAGGSFNVPGIYLTAIPPESGPAAFWVGGTFYVRTAGSNDYTSFLTGGDTLNVSGSTLSGMVVSVTQGGTPMTGTYRPATGAFTVVDQSGNLLPACPAVADGRQVTNSSMPTGYPPAVRVNSEIWCYLGTAADDGAPSATAAYYGNTRTAVYTTDPGAAPLSPDNRRLLKIRLDGSGVVTLTDYSSSSSSSLVGTYSSESHLFQTGTSNPLPMPIYSVDPSNSDALWEPLTPPTGTPATLLVGNKVWRYSGPGASGAALYQGEITGQQLTLAAPDTTTEEGNRVVTISDPVNGVSNVTGTLNKVRGSVLLADGTELYSGDTDGQKYNPTLNASNLHTINADLDITGNVVTFGSLNGNTAKAGTTLQFHDSGGTAGLSSILARPQAQWLWSHVTSSGGGTTPAMQLDTTHKLSLLDPANPNTATIKIDPKTDQVSELPQLKLNNQTLDDTDGTSTHVLTRSLADNRYLRTSGSGQNLALNGSINVNTGTNSTTNTLPGDANAVAIGQNLQAGSGQVVVGKYNTGTSSSDVFVVGAGSTSTKKDALTVSSNGNTVVNGDLSVTGTTTMANATVSGTLSVGSNPVLTQTAGDASYFRKDSPVFAYGAGSSAEGLYSVAFGANAKAFGTSAIGGVAIGTGAVSGGGYAGTDVYNGPWPAGTGGVAIGANSYAGGNSVALGTNAKARVLGLALGFGAEAYGLRSTVLGQGKALGNFSLALGFGATTGASAAYATAVGSDAIANSTRSFAMGEGADTRYPDQTVLGTYNDYPAEVSASRQDSDPVFVIGNGTSDTQRSNALVIKRNGDAEVKRDAKVERNLEVSGDTSFGGKVIITSPAGGIDMGEFGAP